MTRQRTQDPVRIMLERASSGKLQESVDEEREMAYTNSQRLLTCIVHGVTCAERSAVTIRERSPLLTCTSCSLLRILILGRQLTVRLVTP